MELNNSFNDIFWETPETVFQPLLNFEREISDEVPHIDISVLTNDIKLSFVDYVRQGIMLEAVQSSEDILNIKFSEEIKERMRTVTDENINKAMERLLGINKSS